MAKTRPQLIDWVQSRMDEVADDNQLAAIDSQFVDLEIDEAANAIIEVAKPQSIFPLVTEIISKFCLLRKSKREGNAPLSIIVPIPDDFVRLVRFRLYEWLASTPFISEQGSVSDMDMLEADQYILLAPMVELIPFSFSYSDGATTFTTTQALECFPAPATVDETVFRLTPSGTEETNIYNAAAAKGLTTIFELSLTGNQHKEITDFTIVKRKVAENLPDKLHSAMVWQCVGQCLQSLRETSLAQKAFAMAEADLARVDSQPKITAPFTAVRKYRTI